MRLDGDRRRQNSGFSSSRAVPSKKSSSSASFFSNARRAERRRAVRASGPGLLSLAGHGGEQPPAHLVERQPAELPRQALRERVELLRRVVDVGLEDARDDDVGLVDLDDEDLSGGDGQEAQALDDRVEGVRSDDEPDFARQLREQPRGRR